MAVRLVSCCQADDSSEYTLAFEDAQVIPPFLRAETDNTDDTNDTDDTDDEPVTDYTDDTNDTDDTDDTE